MKEAHNMNLTHISFETDSQIVVKALQTSYVGVSLFCVLISSIKNMLLLNSNFEVKFINRQANSVAHKLARVAGSWASRCIFYLIPPCIENELMSEIS
jgi:ribonuclease HI